MKTAKTFLSAAVGMITVLAVLYAQVVPVALARLRTSGSGTSEGDVLDIMADDIFAFDDTRQNPLLYPTEVWEGSDVERMVVVNDCFVHSAATSSTLHGFYTADPEAGAEMGYAMSGTDFHYPMEVYRESQVKDTATTTQFNISMTANTGGFYTGQSFPITSSVALYIRATSTAPVNVAAEDWQLYTGASSTGPLYRYYQTREALRTTDPFNNGRISSVVISSGAGTGYSTSTTGIAGAYVAWNAPGAKFYNGMDINTTPSGVSAKRSVPPFVWSKYWANPIAGGDTASSTSWRQTEVSAGGALCENDTIKMWPNGKTSDWNLGYGTFTSTSSVMFVWGNNDRPLDLYGDGNTTYEFVDGTTQVVDGQYCMVLWSGRGEVSGTDDTHVYTCSANGYSGWSAPVAINDIDPNHASARAIGWLTIGNTEHYWWESNSFAGTGGLWELYHGTASGKGQPITTMEKALASSRIPGDWRDGGAATPWAVEINGKVYLFIKGFRVNEGDNPDSTSLGMVPEPNPLRSGQNRTMFLRGGVAQIPLTSSNTFVGGGYSFSVAPGRTKGIIVTLGAPYDTGTDLTGTTTVQVSVGTTIATGLSALTGTTENVLASSTAKTNIEFTHGTSTSHYATGYLSDVGSSKFIRSTFSSPTIYYVNFLAKKASVAGAGTREVYIPYKVEQLVEIIPETTFRDVYGT